MFIKEIVPRSAIASVANAVYNENYVSLPMSHEIHTNVDGELAVKYEWKFSSGWNTMSLVATGDPALPENGSEEQFITEHYWGYAAQRNGVCMEYRVTHPAWRVWSGKAAKFEGDAAELYGQDLALAIGKAPTSAFLADGSEVTVYRGRKL